MKRLWVKYLSLILILAQTSVLFADTLTFNNGQKINGKLISISEEHELDPNTGVTSEVTFKVDDYQLKMISKELIVGKVDNSTLMFDKKSIYKITDDKGNVIFSTNKNLINSKELSSKLKLTANDNPVVALVKIGAGTAIMCLSLILILFIAFTI